MEVGKQTKLSFNGVDILNVNFMAIAPKDGELKIDLSCTPKVFFPEGNYDVFNIIMDVDLKVDNHFQLGLRAVGNFSIESELEEGLKRSFINSNAPAIMFPYVRAFVATFTANLGNVVGTLTIPTHFFKGELEEIKA